MRPLFAVVVAVVFVGGCAGRPPDSSSATGSIEYVQQEVAPLAAARVSRVLAKEGDTVRVGDTVIVMTQPGLAEEIAGRRARAAEAESQLRDLEAGPRPAEIARAEADVRGAAADADAAEREVSRLSGLAGRGDVSRQQLDDAQTAAAVAAARRDAAQEALRTVRDGTRPERIAAARADVAAARAAVEAGMKSAADLILTAPVGGVVISRHAEPGEVLGPGASMMTIGDVTHPFVRVYVDQTLLPSVRPGDSVAATLDAFPDRHFIGRVASVSTRAEFTPRVALTKDERADLLFGVRVEFTDASGMLKAGLPLTVRFSPGARTVTTPSGAVQGDAAIRIDHLRKTFGKMVAVDGLDLTVNRGEVFGLLGPNGSGKTTTIRMLCGLLEPTSGSASVAGFDVASHPDAVKQNIGYMSQRYGLYDELTVYENIRFYSSVYGLRGDAREARIKELSAELGLGDRLKQRAGTLSGGWKQRLALACATAHKPPVLFLDEPTAGVDPASRRRFWARIHALAAAGITILVTTHYMDEASQCARLGFLSRGHLIALGTPEEIPRMFGSTSIEDVFVRLQEQEEGESVPPESLSSGPYR